MEDDWDAMADEDIVLRPNPINNAVNKWKGEDDDEDVKESWEDEEEKKDEEKPETKPTMPVKTKPNKALKAKIFEQERQLEEEEAARLANMTPEEKLAEKLRIQKIQEDSDLKTALETFGVNNVGTGLDSFNPESKEEFDEFREALSLKISQYKESPHFPLFVEEIVRGICINLPATEIKKVKMNLDTLHTEKLKLEKQTMKKAANKGKAKATLRTENNDIEAFQNYGNDYDDYDDFM